jgi:hypothetical protein
MSNEEIIIPSRPDVDNEVEQAQEPAVFTAVPASKPRNQHLKSPDPKNVQFGGRATQSEAAELRDAIDVNKKEGETYDIVRLALDMKHHIENDVFQSFKTKKKR